MAYKTKQLCFENSRLKYLNLRQASGQMGFEQFFTQLDFGIGLSVTDLNAQANVFAHDLLSRSNFNFRNIFKAADFKIQVERARNTYVYSYVKALLLGFNNVDVKNLPTRSPIFVGHGIFHRLISRSRFIHERDEYSLYLNLNIDETTKGRITKALMSSYPFLSNCVTQSPNGDYCFQDSYYDSCLSDLMDAANNMTDQKSFSGPSNINIQGNIKSSPNVDDNSSYKEETSSMTTSNPSSDDARGNVKAVKIGMRVVEIFDLSDDILDTFINKDYLPLGNSALNVDDRNRWWYTFDVNEPLRYSLNYHICRANFIYLNNSKNRNDLGSGQTYLVALPRNAEMDFLIPRDVRANTYLNVNTNMRPNFLTDGVKVIPDEEFIFNESHLNGQTPSGGGDDDDVLDLDSK